MSTNLLTSSPPLPPEIICEIIDVFVQTEDLASIHACCLVCRAFVSPCQAVLFSRLKVFVPDSGIPDTDFPNKQTRKLNEILRRRPGLASCLNVLCWGASKSEVNITPAFLSLLERLQEEGKVRTLHLYNSRPKVGNFKDASLLRQLTIITSISRLEITNIHLFDPSDLFSACVNLKELQLYKASKSIETNASDNGNNFRPQIELFEDYMSFKMFDPGNVVDFSKLRVLKIYPGSSDSPTDIQTLFKLCAGTLEELHLKKRQRDRFCQLPTFLDLASFPRLHTIDLDVDTDFAFGIMRPAKDPLLVLDDILTTIPAENVVKELALTIFFDVHAISTLEVSLNISWEVLTSQIARISWGKPLRFFLRIMYKPTMLIISGQRDIMTLKEFSSHCKSTFERLALDQKYFNTLPLQISCDINQGVLDI